MEISELSVHQTEISIERESEVGKIFRCFFIVVHINKSIEKRAVNGLFRKWGGIIL